MAKILQSSVVGLTGGCVTGGCVTGGCVGGTGVPASEHVDSKINSLQW